MLATRNGKAQKLKLAGVVGFLFFLVFRLISSNEQKS